MSTSKETDLYHPIKALLHAQGYEVKAEVAKADIVAKRADELPVIVELKLGFTLMLFHQAIERLKVTEHVYIAVAHQSGKAFSCALAYNVALARRAGIGVITVRLRDNHVIVHADPGPYASKHTKAKQKKLLRAFERLKGDPNTGGAQSKHVITGYRQDALGCVEFIRKNGASRGADIKKIAGIIDATRIMRDNHYGWFTRIKTGLYDLSTDAPSTK